jgi:hypothetical protein
MCRSSSRVITFRARGALLPLFTMTCANSQAVERRRTLFQVLDHCPLSVRPTAAHLAAFILPSRGWSFSATLPLRHWCDVLRILTIGTKVSHYGPRSDDLSTNKLSAGALAANGRALVTPPDGAS